MSDRVILLAEDTEALRLLVTLKLEASGYTVHAVADGLEALDAFQAHRPWAVVTDYAMPRMHGLELARRLKELAPEIPVILWSSQILADTTPADYVIVGKELDPLIERLDTIAQL